MLKPELFVILGDRDGRGGLCQREEVRRQGVRGTESVSARPGLDSASSGMSRSKNLENKFLDFFSDPNILSKVLAGTA